jgi:hypothetical protein
VDSPIKHGPVYLLSLHPGSCLLLELSAYAAMLVCLPGQLRALSLFLLSAILSLHRLVAGVQHELLLLLYVCRWCTTLMQYRKIIMAAALQLP